MAEAKSPNRSNNDLVLKFVVGPKYRLWRHLFLIILLGMGFAHGRVNYVEPINTYVNFSIFVILLFILYVNMYLFVPRLLLQDRYLGYVLWLIALFFFIRIIVSSARGPLAAYRVQDTVHLENGTANFFFIFIFFILMGASAAVKLFQRWVADSRRINELETNTIYTELENLKKQINPHFLFNTLNNVNMLTQKDPDKASQIIMN